MKSITIHNLDPETAKALDVFAQKNGSSLNKTIKELLRKALGLEGKKGPQNQFSAFCGLWSTEELQEFEAAIKPFEEPDPEFWG